MIVYHILLELFIKKSQDLRSVCVFVKKIHHSKLSKGEICLSEKHQRNSFDTVTLECVSKYLQVCSGNFKIP